jgi:mRNA interferase MazF
MTIYKRGDVVLVPFPFSDQSTSRKRPAVIISSDRYNKLSSDVIIMAITSKTHQADGLAEYAIEDWEKTGLLAPSLVKPAVSTIELKLIIKKLGRFSSKGIHVLEKALTELFGLKP